MGEYATRISDGERIKIGTCEEMLYLRYEDRAKVRKVPGSLDAATTLGLFWRLPFPDEDGILPGDYRTHGRGERLYKLLPKDTQGWQGSVDFAPADLAENPGIMQMYNESGVLLNVKCYHGIRLPDCGPDVQAHWNGISWFLELASLKNRKDGKVVPVVHCRFCRSAWSFEWADVMPYLNGEMAARLAFYAE